MRKFALAATLVAAAFVPAAMASATTFTSETVSFGPTATDFDTGVLSLAGFSSSLGTLTGVTIDYYYTATISGSTKNTATKANTFTVNASSDATFSFTGAYSTDADLSVASSQKYTNLAAGATAAFGTFTPDASDSIALSDASDLAGFIGHALLVDISTASGYGFTGGGNNAQATLSQFGSGYVTITYAYDEAVTPPPAVPEPASWAMMLVGFGAMGGTLRRNRRTSVKFG